MPTKNELPADLIESLKKHTDSAVENLERFRENIKDIASTLRDAGASEDDIVAAGDLYREAEAALQRLVVELHQSERPN